MQYAVIIEATATGFSAYAPDLPGCIATGATRTEVSLLMEEDIKIHLKDMYETGQEIPMPATYSESEPVEFA